MALAVTDKVESEVSSSPKIPDRQDRYRRKTFAGLPKWNFGLTFLIGGDGLTRSCGLWGSWLVRLTFGRQAFAFPDVWISCA